MTTASDVVMSEAQPEQIDARPSETYRLTFPRDFPPVPQGVTIIPFKDFRERGIQRNPGLDDAEVDALGILTVPMPHGHHTDVCKTDTKRKKMKEMTAEKREAGIALTWYEQWEERESVRIAKPGNSSDSRLTRFVQASDDFEVGRKWPAGMYQTDLLYLWNQIKLFLGLSGGIAPSKKTSGKAFLAPPVGQGNISDDDEDVDDEGDDASVSSGAAVNGSFKDRKALAFLANPEKSVKIFLSSHARAKGLIWSHSNLENTPRLWRFFLQFLIRSRVLPQLENGFRSALEVADLALKELPIISKIAKDFPDDFSKGCKGCWGAKNEIYTTLRLDDDFLATHQSAVEEVVPEESNGGGWGSGGWGGSDEDTDNPWSSTSVVETDVNDLAPWTSPEQHSLLSLLGPTALPLTHMTSIVESSVRRIKSITLPPLPSAVPKSSALAEDDAAYAGAVETELERSFAKVVFSPWLNWDGGQVPVYSSPRILETSQGPVVDPPYVEKDATTPATPQSPGPKPHDPAIDDITLLVHPSVAELLSVGISFTGTWVQIARLPVTPDGDAGERPAKKRKKGKKKPTPKYWYLDDLAVVFPSFWAVSNV